MVGPEVLRGSTRLTAGTAQKVALNALTTAAMVRLGRVHGDLMIDVEPANAKLRDRAAGHRRRDRRLRAERRDRGALRPAPATPAPPSCTSCSGCDPAAALERAGRFASLRDALAAGPVSDG